MQGIFHTPFQLKEVEVEVEVDIAIRKADPEVGVQVDTR